MWGILSSDILTSDNRENFHMGKWLLFLYKCPKGISVNHCPAGYADIYINVHFVMYNVLFELGVTEAKFINCNNMLYKVSMKHKDVTDFVEL